KGIRCSVAGCDGEAVRSISALKAEAAGMEVEGRRAYLCREHYKAFKKRSRMERRVERWRHGIP
ncbi:MAG: hypothetical protein ACE5OO_07555, partial [Candidatus Bathyarchaeia archaeon]